MNQIALEKQSLIDGFLNVAESEDKRVSFLSKLSEIDEETAIDLINKAFQKKPSVSFTASLAALLPKMKSDNAYELTQKYVKYLLKYDIERLPRHTDILVVSLPVLNAFNRPGSADIILSAYSRFRNQKKEQKAIVESGIYQKLLSGNITEQQRIEILIITGDYDTLATLKKNEDFDSAFGKMVKMHSDSLRIKKDLDFLKQRGDMELYKEIREKVRGKLMPMLIGQAALIAGSVVLVIFVIFLFTFIFGHDLSRNQIINKITGFGIFSFCAFIIIGTIVLFKYKNR